MYFDHLAGYIEGFKDDILGYSKVPETHKIVYLIGKFIVQNEAFNFLVIILIFFLLVIVWSPSSIAQKALNILIMLSNGFYFLLISVAISSFLNAIYLVIKDTNNINGSLTPEIFPALILAGVISSFIDCIWKLSKKSTLRKYFNGLYLIFSSIFWYVAYNPTLRGMSFNWDGSLDLFAIAIFFYFISLIIAVVEFIIKRTSKPKTNPVASEQTADQ